MPRPTNDQMFEWANEPPEWQYVGHAHSQEELEDLHDMAVEGRRDFLLKAAQHEMARRALVVSQSPETTTPNTETKFDFTAIPRRGTVSLVDCETLATIHQYQSVMKGERPSWDATDAKRKWKQAAQDFAIMNGHAIDTPKFSDRSFKPWNSQYKADEEEMLQIAEERYQSMLRHSAEDEKAGYSLRFLMDGILRVDEAYLDLESLEQMLKKQRRRSPNTRYFGEYAFNFWDELMHAKREFDRKGPYRDKQTYADVVDEIAPGVYSAPYIDPTLVRSRQFISIDDWRRASLGVEGEQDMPRLVRGFNDVTTLVAYGDRFGKRRDYFSQADPLNRFGATFFDRALLPKALQILEHEKAGRYIIPMVEFLIHESDHMRTDSIDPDYLYIVFGEQSVSSEVDDVLRR